MLGFAAAAGRYTTAGGGGCVLGAGGKIRHVIYMQFDNTHYTRDNPNVPSDLQQMPNLRADPIVDYTTSASAPVGDSSPTMVTPSGVNAPAPWVSYTRAGCNFGTVAGANTELENTTPDVPLVFGANSPEAREAENPKLAAKAAADFEGLAVHCAQGAGVCAHGQPARGAARVRGLERAASRLTGQDLATRKTVRLTNYLADPVELTLLHMVTGDPKRTPSLVLFGNQDFWLASGKASCGSSCFSEPKGTDAWNHGDVSPQINTTWLGMAGPGVAHRGVDTALWSDHTDIQPTMMALLGLRDDYAPDGRVLGEVFDPAALPAGMRADQHALLALGRVYSQIEAPVGAFGLDMLRASTRALASHSPGDAEYARIEGQLLTLGAERDAIGNRMRSLLLGAAFGGQPVDAALAAGLIRQGERLIVRASVLAR